MDEKDIFELKYVIQQVSYAFFRRYGEPMPDFESHDRAKLQGALNAPFQSAFGDDIYGTPFLKAAALFYFIAKDHPFENGNKRTAVIAMLWYLATQKIGVGLSPRRLYEIAVAIVSSKLPHDKIIPEVAEILELAHLPFEDWVDDEPGNEEGPAWSPDGIHNPQGKAS